MTGLCQHRLINADSNGAVPINLNRGKLCLFAKPSPGHLVNEDSVAAILLPQDQCIIALSDGVGGSARGASASRLAVNAILSSVESEPFQAGSQRRAILDGFENGNQLISDLAVGAASTLVVVEFYDGWVRTYHAGDSGCFVTGQRGRIKYRTIDHSPVSYAHQAGILTEREALSHDERHLVSNVLGDNDMSVQISSPVRLAARDTVLIASDGVFDNSPLDDLAQAIRVGPIDQAAMTLWHLVREKMGAPAGKPDDVTFAVFRGS